MQNNDKNDQADFEFVARSGGAPEIYTIAIVVRQLIHQEFTRSQGYLERVICYRPGPNNISSWTIFTLTTLLTTGSSSAMNSLHMSTL